jgi:uncharacterized protein
MRGFLDRDFVSTAEGMFFCVVGGVHPRDRVISYLKYVPTTEGKWGKGQRYTRTMQTYTIPSLLANIDNLSASYPRYVFNSKAFHIRMSAVPKSMVKEHYKPEKKLEQILNAKKPDPLQLETIQLVTYLAERASIPLGAFGVTGSILLDIHNPEFSDIDLLIYGRKNSLRLRETLKEELEKGEVIQRISGPYLERQFRRWTTNYHLTQDEAEEFFSRRWNIGFFNKRVFSVHPTKIREETNERYGEKVYTPIGIATGEGKITDTSNSLYLPGTYLLDKLVLDPGSGLKEQRMIRELISYDGFYTGIFDLGEKVKVKGKLEKVYDKRSRETGYRVLVGSPEAKGLDFIKPT